MGHLTSSVDAVGRRRRIQLLCVLVAFGTMLVMASAFATSSRADDIYYCQQYVSGYNACPQHANGYFNENHAYVPGQNFGGVCEKVTIIYHALAESYS